jgi:hypothetical protein
VLVSVADSRTESLRDSGDGLLVALTGGYNAAFLAAAAFAVTGALGRPSAAPRGAVRAGGDAQGELAATEPAPEPSAA